MNLTNLAISPSDMLLFNDVVQLHSFTAAARKNGISKQAVSERISRLEATLGVRLLHRTTRMLKPTEAGQRYQIECSRIAVLIEQANAAALAEQSEATGTLTVSVPNIFGRGRLLDLLGLYLQRNPKVRINLCLADRLVHLVDEGVDVALRVSHLNEATLSVRRLGTVYAYFAASPKLLLNYGASSEIDVIRNAPAITFRDGEVWTTADGTKIRPNSVMTIDDLMAVSFAAVKGIGIARLPGMLCLPLVDNGELKLLQNGEPAASLTVYAAYLSKKQLSPKIRNFIDLLVENRSLFTDAE